MVRRRAAVAAAARWTDRVDFPDPPYNDTTAIVFMVARPPRQVAIAVSRHPVGSSLRFLNHIIATRRVNESGDLQFT
jgi:hypothetical protein